jgi:hypothetical protein
MRRGKRLLVLSRIWYALIGVAGIGASSWTFIDAVASGCRVEFSRMHARSSAADGCVQRLDTPLMVVAGVAGLLLVCASLWVTDRAPAERSVAAVGIGVGFLLSLVPAWAAISVASFYGAGEGGVWLYVAVGVALTVIGVCAAAVLVRAWIRGT